MEFAINQCDLPQRLLGGRGLVVDKKNQEFHLIDEHNQGDVITFEEVCYLYYLLTGKE
jgi:hypothetical protein